MAQASHELEAAGILSTVYSCSFRLDYSLQLTTWTKKQPSERMSYDQMRTDFVFLATVTIGTEELRTVLAWWR